MAVVADQVPPATRAEEDESPGSGVGLGLGESATLAPPYDPAYLSMMFGTSAYLRPNIDAYVVNIDSHGHRFEPRIDLGAPEARETLRELLEFDRWIDAIAAGQDVAIDEVVEVTEAEVDAAIGRLRIRMRRERIFLDRWFATATTTQSFIELRREKGMDLEKHGNAYWEVVRDDRGDIVYFERVKARSVRLRRRDKSPTQATRPVIRTPLRIERVGYSRCFRTFVQEVRGRKVFFKEFGDPRVVSRATGEVYGSFQAMQTKEPNAQLANELVHFRVVGSDSEYGEPRWVGAFLSVLGSRIADQVNIDYFRDRIPPMAAFVTGGKFTKETTSRLESIIEGGRGVDKFHKILILEADPAPSTSMDATAQAKITLQPFQRPTDATHQRYDARSGDKIGSAYRMPKILRGETEGSNRATANMALRMGEGQIWEPERRAFDAWWNDMIMPAIGVSCWVIHSLGPRVVADVDTSAKTAVEAFKFKILDRGEARRVLGESLGLSLSDASEQLEESSDDDSNRDPAGPRPASKP